MAVSLGETNLAEMTCDEVWALFESSAEISFVLRKEKVDGLVLESSTQEELVEVGLTTLQAKTVIKKREKIRQERMVQGTVKSCSQEPRKFLKTQDDASSITYEEGTILPPESACSTNSDRTVEYKELDCPLKDIEIPLVTRYVKFLVGCLNARINGTISFGVSDFVTTVKKGIHLPKEKWKMIHDIMENHIYGLNPIQFQEVRPEMLAAIRQCARPPVFIPIRRTNGEADYVVIECDVHPTSQACRNTIFFRKIKLDPLKKKKITREIYLRQGTSTVQINEDKSEFEVLRAAARLSDEEQLEMGQVPSTVEDRLARLLCQGHQRIDDDIYSYILVIDKLSNVSDFKEWLPNIKWSFVLDFDSSAAMLNQVKDDFTMPPVFLTMAEVKQEFAKCVTNERFRRSVEYGHRTVWLSCSEDNKTYQSWIQEAKTTITKTVHAMTDEAAIQSQKRLIFLYVLESSFYRHITDLLVDACGIVHQTSQLIAVTTDKSTENFILSHLRPTLGQEWLQKQCLRISSWNFLKTLMINRIDKPLPPGLTIPCSSGEAGIEISTATHEKFRKVNIDILASNQCHEQNFSIGAINTTVNKGNEIIKLFFKGGKPSWELFFYSSMKIKNMLPGPVERPHVMDITKAVKELLQKKANPVQVKKIVHQSGSGASTIAMNVLWNVKHEHRCLVIDGNAVNNAPDTVGEIQQLADRVMRVRSLGEGPDTRKGSAQYQEKACLLLILLDNANDEMATMLKNNIEAKFKEAEIVSRQTQIVIMYITVGVHVDSSLSRSLLHTSFIRQTLLESEKKMFHALFQKVKVVLPPETMLGFVVIAFEFDANPDYVEGIIDKALIDIDVNSRQVKLLVYLCLLSKFCKEASCYTIPEKHCRRYLDRHEDNNPRSFIKMVCDQVRLFLIRDKESVYNETVYTVRILHRLVADVLLNKLLKKRTLSKILLELLEEKNLFNEPYNAYKFHRTIRKFLTFRAVIFNNEDERKKEKFSDIIQHIDKERNPSAPVTVLTAAYNILNEEEKSVIAQAIARLYNSRLLYESAIKWANNAINDAHQTPHEFACYDTLGQIYRNKLREELKSKEKRKSYSINDLDTALQSAVLACDNFNKARLLFGSRHGFAVIEKDEYAKKSFLTDTLVGDSYALDGIVECNLMVVSLILGTSLLKKTQPAKTTVLTFVRNGTFRYGEIREQVSETELGQLDRFEELWNEHNMFFSRMYSHAKSCLADCVRRLSESRGLARMIERRCEQFSNWFSEDIMQLSWKNIVGSTSMSYQEKLRALQPYSLPLVIHNFKYALALKPLLLKNFQDLIQDVEQINEENNLEEEEHEKICYITIYFALMLNKTVDINLKLERVKEISLELVTSNEPHNLHPEWCLMFLVLYWPVEELDDQCHGEVPMDIENKFRFCLKWLQDYHRNLKIAHPGPLFRLSSGHRDNCIIRPDGRNNGHWFKGQKNLHGDITISLDGFRRPMNIRCELKERRIVGDVYFYINFTLYGPIAFNVTQQEEYLTKDTGDGELVLRPGGGSEGGGYGASGTAGLISGATLHGKV